MEISTVFDIVIVMLFHRVKSRKICYCVYKILLLRLAISENPVRSLISKSHYLKYITLYLPQQQHQNNRQREEPRPIAITRRQTE